MRALKSVNKYLWRYRWLLLTGILFVGLANVFQVYAPRYIGEMIDLVTVNFDAVVKQNDTKLADEVYRGVLISGLLFLGFTILRGIFMFFMRQTIIVMSRKIEYDQKNDLFIVRADGMTALKMIIWNRWGEIVYETDNPSDPGWDGTYKGKEATPDSFAWYVWLTCGNGDIFESKGNVTLLK